MNEKMLQPYMETARAFAKLSYAVRKKVGGIAVTPQDVVVYSWNGRVAGGDNVCEIEGQDVTRPDVLHCESNIVAKAAREGISLKGSIVVVTLSPCLPCSMQMYQAGVARVVYDEEYRNLEGVEFLKSLGVQVEQYKDGIINRQEGDPAV